MKKIIAGFLAFFLLTAFETGNPKMFTVTADVATWNEILKVVDLSKADPEKRIAVREFILSQLNDTTINKK